MNTDNTIKKEIVVKGKDKFIDDRGTISNYYLTENINSVGLIETKTGSVRSNHYHPEQEQKLLLVSGKYISICKDLTQDNSPIVHQLIEPGDFVITPPMVAHTTIYIEDSVVINFVNGDRMKDNFDKHTIHYELVPPNDIHKYLEIYKDK
tara:strand:+ start:94 stop:543 length:450 start_codon:yes stop_codon:yes gene_type:complete